MQRQDPEAISPDEAKLGNAQVWAFFHKIAPFTVGLLFSNGDTGTGTFLKYRTSYGILTANHNLRDTKPSSIRFVHYPGGALTSGAMTEGPKGNFSPGSFLAVRDDVLIDKENDIAFIGLNTNILPEGASFYEVTGKVPVLTDGNTIIVIGFAWNNQYLLSEHSRVIGVTTQTGRYDSRLSSRTDLSLTYDSNHHFLLPFTRIDEGVSPHGISGAAVWANGNHKGPIWEPRPLLVGVQTAWFPSKKLLKITRLKCVLKLLKNKKPPA